MIASEEINATIEKINTFILAGNHQRNYSEVIIRQEEATVLVNFFKRTKANINYQGLFLMLGGNFGIFETYKNETTHKIGKKFMSCKEFGLECHFSPLSFHQVNDEVGQKLYQRVLDNLQGKNILNCYSGAGVLSGIMAVQGKRVVGVELGRAEHQDAEFLKDLNHLFFLTNIKGDCAAVLPKLEEKFDTVVIDPPRAGIAEKVVEALNNLKFKRLIYISCNSATLTRDLTRLKGLTFKKVMLFDMFARTGEYETVVVLDKK
jgi:23S rRNA (uracil1939-C5)-methyltransferase